MATFQFEITQSGHDTIKIEADDGFLIDDWHELTTATCLIIDGGLFKRHTDKTVFGRDGQAVVTLNGDPLGTDTQGAATLEPPDNGCPGDGWTWRRL